MLYTDPARHPALVLVEALDLSQVSGRGALHLETLLGKKDSQRTEQVFTQNEFILSTTLKDHQTGDTFTSAQHLKLLLSVLPNTTDTNRSLFPCRRLYHWQPQKLCNKVFTLHSALYHQSILGVYVLCVNSVPAEAWSKNPAQLIYINDIS